MEKQTNYEEKPLDRQPGTPEFEAKFKRIWKAYREWFNANDIEVGATKADYRGSKIGIRIGVECGYDDKDLLEKWIQISSFKQYIHSSVAC